MDLKQLSGLLFSLRVKAKDADHPVKAEDAVKMAMAQQ